MQQSKAKYYRSALHFLDNAFYFVWSPLEAPHYIISVATFMLNVLTADRCKKHVSNRKSYYSPNSKCYPERRLHFTSNQTWTWKLELCFLSIVRIDSFFISPLLFCLVVYYGIGKFCFEKKKEHSFLKQTTVLLKLAISCTY